MAGPAPFLSMVNLVAGRKIVPELIQGEMTAERIAAEAMRLLESRGCAARRCRPIWRRFAAKLESDGDPMETAAGWIEQVFGADRME